MFNVSDLLGLSQLLVDRLHNFVEDSIRMDLGQLGQIVFDSILRSAGRSTTEQSRAVQRVLFVSVWFSLGGALLTLIGLKVDCRPSSLRSSERRRRPVKLTQAQYEAVQ